MRKSDLRQIIKEELNELRVAGAGHTKFNRIRKTFYDLSDSAHGFETLTKDLKNPKLSKIIKQIVNNVKILNTFLDTNYKGWD